MAAPVLLGAQGEATLMMDLNSARNKGTCETLIGDTVELMLTNRWITTGQVPVITELATKTRRVHAGQGKPSMWALNLGGGVEVGGEAHHEHSTWSTHRGSGQAGLHLHGHGGGTHHGGGRARLVNTRHRPNNGAVGAGEQVEPSNAGTRVHPTLDNERHQPEKTAAHTANGRPPN